MALALLRDLPDQLSRVQDNINAEFQAHDTKISALGSAGTRSGVVKNVIGNYTVQDGDRYICCDPTNGPVTIRMPAASVAQRAIEIKDATGKANTNHITVYSLQATDTIDNVAGNAGYVMTNNFGYVRFQSDGATRWMGSPGLNNND